LKQLGEGGVMNVGYFEEVKGVEAENPPDIRQTSGPLSDTRLSLVYAKAGVLTRFY